MLYIAKEIIRLLLMGIPGLAGLFLLNRLSKSRPSLQWKTGFRQWRRALPLLIAACGCYGALCVGYYQIHDRLSGSFKLGYNYPEASKGLTPNKTRLDTSEIVSDEVLEAAINNGMLAGLTAEDLRDTLTIQNVEGKSGISTDSYYLSTEYRVSYEATRETQDYDSQELLSLISKSYYDYFVNQYSRKINALTADFTVLETMDYLDIYTYLSTRISNISDYMNMCKAENPSYVSPTIHESFSTIAEKASNYKNVALDRFKAYVLKYGLSKNREQYVSKLNYDNKILNVKYMKNLASYSVRLAAIDKYERDIITPVLVPTRGTDGEFYQSRTKIGTDYFAADANQYLEDATSKQLEIETNNYSIGQLNTSFGSQENYNKAEQMIVELTEQITEISGIAIDMVKEYDAKTCNNYINITYQDRGNGITPHLKKIVFCSGALFMILSMTVFFKERKGRRSR